MAEQSRSRALALPAALDPPHRRSKAWSGQFIVQDVLLALVETSGSGRVLLTFTFGGRTIVRCFLEKTRDGFCLGLIDPRLGDVHLTIMFKDGSISAHITDRSRDPPYVYTQKIVPDILGRSLERRLRRWVRRYHPNTVAWVMRPVLRRRVERALRPEIEGNEIRTSLEATEARLALDFENKSRWKRVRVRDLLKMPGELAFREDKGRGVVVRPLDREVMLQFTEGQANALLSVIWQALGAVQYGDYIADKLQVRDSGPSSEST